jgi:glycosyltransferase involved in cell wall biosynthesis
MKENLYYIANIRLPTEKAHGIQIMEMCESFAEIGLSVELIVPTRHTPITDDPFDYYKINKNFSIRKSFCIDAVSWGPFGFRIEAVTFMLSAVLHVLGKKGIIYTRDELIAFVLKMFGKNVVWEAHMGQENFFARSIVKWRIPLIVITQGLKDLYERYGMPKEMIWVSPDGVDLKDFSISDTRESARKATGLGLNDKIVLYTGHLYSWKGADALAQSAKFIPESIKIVFVGGTENDIKTFKEKYGSIPNVLILGKKPHHEMPLYLRAADVLTIPNSAKEDISRLYTSPMKLFEYIASGTPVIASDLPSLREILNDTNAFFFRSDDPEDTAKVIKYVFENNAEAKKRADKALIDSLGYSWEERARNIIDFLKKIELKKLP